MRFSRMTLKEAMTPFHGYAYNFNGHVDSSGEVVQGGLGCSGFVSAVLHRMQHGKDWLKSFNPKVHQLYGDQIAKTFSLPPAGQLDSKTLSNPSALRAKIASGEMKADGLYMFNVRNGQAGHVGFVRVKADGTLEQAQYSGLQAYNGLATGNF